MRAPEEAVGKQLIWIQPGAGPGPQPSDIVGVVPDLPVSVSQQASPAIYFVFDEPWACMSIRAKPDEDFAFTVSEIQRLWKATNNVRPIQLTFYAESRRVQYLDIIIQGTLIGICAGGRGGDRLPRAVRALGLRSRAADEGDRHPQGAGRDHIQRARPADVAVHRAGALGDRDRHAGRLLADDQLAAGLQPTASTSRPGHSCLRRAWRWRWRG